jgi:hypothetical protein
LIVDIIMPSLVTMVVDIVMREEGQAKLPACEDSSTFVEFGRQVGVR